MKRRKFLGYEILNRKEDIDLTLDELLRLIRELIKIEDRANVIQILSKPSHCWIEEVEFAVKMIGGTAPKLLQEEILFHEKMMDEDLYKEFKAMQGIAEELYEQIDKFLVNHF